MNKNRGKEHVLLGLVFAGSILIITSILVFAVYSLQSIDFIQIRITSIGSMFAFIVLLLLGLGLLSIIGTLIDSLRKHLFQTRFKLTTMIMQEILLIAIFGVIIYAIDQWIDGVEIGNMQTEILLALFLYGIVTLLGKMGDQIRKQDNEHRGEEI